MAHHLPRHPSLCLAGTIWSCSKASHMLAYRVLCLSPANCGPTLLDYLYLQVLFTKLPSALDTANLLVTHVFHVFQLHGSPSDIVLDKGTKLTLKVWQAVGQMCNPIASAARLFFVLFYIVFCPLHCMYMCSSWCTCSPSALHLSCSFTSTCCHSVTSLSF